MADGVGGWNSKGVDPGIFAREFCSHIKDSFLAQKTAGKKTYEIDLMDLLVSSVLKT